MNQHRHAQQDDGDRHERIRRPHHRQDGKQQSEHDKDQKWIEHMQRFAQRQLFARGKLTPSKINAKHA